ncbi:MAG: response regulator, partial [Gorillibacterium sp.]|nr:response regulator [Gorillibacterium sp.]
MREQILVIDDDEKITSMLRRGLAFEGYTVTTANDGLDGLKKVMEIDPRLIILDVMMPKVDGWEVCRRIRESGSVTSILMLTAKDEVADRVKGLDMGADDYLVKPFALEELLARVRMLLRRNTESGFPKANKLEYADLVLDSDAREVFRDDKRIDLT